MFLLKGPAMAKRPATVKKDDAMQGLCRYIAARCDETLLLRDLAARAGLSPFHLQRRFKAEIGVSPREYQESCRLKTLKSGLQNKSSVTEAIYDAGFSSSSRVYSRSDTRLGMTPRQYRLGGKTLQISYADATTPLGRLMIGATDRGICFIQFGADADSLYKFLQEEFPAAILTPMDGRAKGQFSLWIENLSDYLNGQSTLINLPLDIRGTAFQMKVWKYLQKIPAGSTRSYAEVAKGIGHPSAARAVACACATNRIAIAVPCHRVIRGDGAMSGYRWNPERKRRLLDIEKGKRP
jgi:AraC family transcriptional regulator, regulatory protein of adaptative response / methylated-DNA-[protein]-cysteine methyltransferase